MSKTILITRPNYDSVTRYLYYWAKMPIQSAKDKGIEILDLKVERSNKKDFSRAMKKNPSLIVINGDGNSNGSIDFDKSLIEDDSNINDFKSKIVCAFPCKTARILSVKNIETESLAYMGYDENFIFCCMPGKTYDPLEDALAHLFLDPPMFLVSNILDNLTVGESFEKIKELYRKNIREAKESEYDFAAPFLLWDMRHLKLVGDKNVRI